MGSQRAAWQVAFQAEAAALKSEHYGQSLLDLVKQIKPAKRRKAAGPDFIPDDLRKVAPWELTKLWFPTLLKAALESQGPIQMKGGKAGAFFYRSRISGIH